MQNNVSSPGNGRAKLTDYQVWEIRESYDWGGVTQRELAQYYGCSLSQINRIINHKSRRAVL